MVDAALENPEKKPASVEKGASPQSAEQEAANASSKGASEVYGARQNGADKSGDQTSSGDSAKKEEQAQAGAFENKEGDVWYRGDDEVDGGLLYGKATWKTLFSWSKEERTESNAAKSESTDSWLSSLGFDNVFGSGGKTVVDDSKKPEAEKDKQPESKSLLDELSDGELTAALHHFGREIFGSDSKDQTKATDAKGDAAADSISLPDGSKVAKDGSWVQLSPEAQKLSETSGDKPIIHKYKDQDGKEATLEISQGRVFHVAGDGTRTEVTDKRITVNGTDGTVTSKDKQTGEVRAQNAERGVSYEQGQNGSSTFTVGDVKITREGSKFVVVDGDNNTQTLSPEEFRLQWGKRIIRQRTSHDQTGEPPNAPDDPDRVETNSSGVAFRDNDGSTIGVNIAKRLVSIRLEEGPEILIDRHGLVRVREAAGEPQELDRKKLPPGLTIDEDGNICLKNGMKIGPDGRLHTKRGDTVDSRTGDVTVKDETTGKSVKVSTGDNGTSTLTDDKGKQLSKVNPDSGEVTTTTSHGEPIIYNCRTRQLRVEDAKDGEHPIMIMGPKGDQLWDGTEVGPNGEIILPDGTYIDEEGNVRFYDGTEVDKDGDVVSADGKTLSSNHEGVRLSTTGIASYADALASSIASKANPAAGDIAALQAALGVLGSLLPALTNAGSMDAYARLKDSQGNILQALSQAQGKG